MKNVLFSGDRRPSAPSCWHSSSCISVIGQQPMSCIGPTKEPANAQITCGLAIKTSYYRMRVFLTLQVTTAQDAHVMQFVSGNDVSQRANADIILVCLSVSQPLRFI